MAHQKLLAALGLRSYLCPSELLKCAACLSEACMPDGQPDGKPLSDDRLAQSFWLVEALSANLQYTLNRTDEAKRKPKDDILAAFKLRQI
jgi:hypothetical protein